MHSTLTAQEKYKIIQQNSYRFNLNENKTITELGKYTFEGGTDFCCEHFVKKVQLQSFYKCCIPAIEILLWEQEINYKVMHPIAAIVAFKNNGFFGVSVELSKWAESGGIRLVPLKASASKDKIKEIVTNVHAVIVPQFQTGEVLPLFQDLAEVIKDFSHLPVLALGNSAIMLMGLTNQAEELIKKTKFDIKFHNAEMLVFSSHQHPLFFDLDLKLRLQMENRPRIVSSLTHLPYSLYASLNKSFLEILALGRGKMQNITIVTAKQSQIYYSFIDPRPNAINLDSIAFCHKLLINFLQQIRKSQKNIDQKIPQLGLYKVILHQQKFYYNTDIKSTKN